MSDLKPCPFCGEEGRLIKSNKQDHVGGNFKQYVVCAKSHDGLPCHAALVYKTAILAWNRRVHDERAEKVIEAARALYNAKAPASDSQGQLPGQPWRRLQDALREWETR